MHAYSLLSSYNADLRRKGLTLLFTGIEQDPSHISYTMRRLIKGLASNQKCTRVGYFGSLCMIIRQFNPDLTDIVEQLDDLIPCSAPACEDKNSAVIGRVFWVQAFLISDYLKNDSSTTKIERCINQLMKLFDIADRRLYFRITSTIIQAIEKSVELDCSFDCLKCIRSFLPEAWDGISEAKCYFLLEILSNHKDTFQSTFNIWKRLLFNFKKSANDNILKFLFAQKEPLICEGFESAAALSFIANKFEEFWSALIDKLKQNHEPELLMTANNHYILLRTIQRISKVNLSETSASNFFISGFDPSLLVASTNRNRIISKATVSEIAKHVVLQCTVDSHKLFVYRYIDVLIDEDSSLLFVLLSSFRQHCVNSKQNDTLFWLTENLFLRVDLLLTELMNDEIANFNRPITHKLCFLLDQISQTMRSIIFINRDTPNELELLKCAFSLLSRFVQLRQRIKKNTIASQTTTDCVPSSISRQIERVLLYIISIGKTESSQSSPLTTYATIPSFGDAAKSYQVFLNTKESIVEDDTSKKIWYEMQPIFQLLMDKSINVSNVGLKYGLNSLVWTTFIYQLMEATNLDTADLLTIIEQAYNPEDALSNTVPSMTSSGLDHWTTVLSDFLLIIAANASHYVQAQLVKCLKMIGPSLNASSIDVFIEAIKDEHEIENEKAENSSIFDSNQSDPTDMEAGNTPEDDFSASAVNGEDSDMEDLPDDSLPDDTEIIEQFHSARSKLSSKKPKDNSTNPSTVFKSRCVDFLFVYVTAMPDVFFKRLSEITKLTMLPSSIVPAVVAKKIKTLLQQTTLFKKKALNNKYETCCLSGDNIESSKEITNQLNLAIEYLVNIDLSNTTTDQCKLICHALTQMSHLRSNYTPGDDSVIIQTYLNQLTTWTHSIASRFLKNKLKILHNVKFQESVRAVPYICTMLIMSLASLAAETQNALKHFTVNSTATAIRLLINKDMIRSSNEIKPDKCLRKYLISLLDYCFENAKAKRQGSSSTSVVFFPLAQKCLRLGLLSRKSEQALYDRLNIIKSSKEDFESCGMGWKNRTYSMMDNLKNREKRGVDETKKKTNSDSKIIPVLDLSLKRKKQSLKREHSDILDNNSDYKSKRPSLKSTEGHHRQC